MQLTNYTISSSDINEFESSTDRNTIEWLKFFKEFNPYKVTIEQADKLKAEIDTVRELVYISEGKSKKFSEWKLENLIRASRIDLGKVPPSTSCYAYGILIARMVLAYHLVKGDPLNNGQSIAEQVQALGFK